MTIHVLTRRVAPVQQGFYFVNDSMSADGRCLWFYCAFPPALHRTLAVIDFADQTVRHFPETSAAGAYVDPDSGDVFWSERPTVWRRGPREEDVPVPVNHLPPEIVGGRHVAGLAESLYHEHRLRVAREQLARFPEMNDLGRAEGESLWSLGRRAEAEATYRSLIAEMPDHGWAYIGWSDHYHWEREGAVDHGRIESISGNV